MELHLTNQNHSAYEIGLAILDIIPHHLQLVITVINHRTEL